MKSKTFTTGSVLAGFLALGLTVAVPAQASILIDFGSDASWRGLSTPGPDENGNYWNSVDSFSYFVDLIDNNGVATTTDFGFGASAGGTDSYNGPAGPTSAPTPTPAEIALTAFNAAALGNLGATNAVIDFYDHTQFTIQDLDPAKTYNLTFYGSHKYDTPGITTYSVFTSNDYAVVVTSDTLAHNDDSINDFEWEHNQDRTVTISGVSPQFANSIWIGVDGYVNAMEIEVVPEPGTLAMLLMGGVLMVVRRNRR